MNDVIVFKGNTNLWVTTRENLTHHIAWKYIRSRKQWQRSSHSGGIMEYLRYSKHTFDDLTEEEQGWVMEWLLNS